MKCCQAFIMLILAAVLSGPFAQAQPFQDTICRVATAEVADFVDGVGWTNNVTDSNGSCEFGACTFSATAVLGAATTIAGQTTSARSTVDSVLVSGSMFVQIIQSGADARHYFFPYATVGGTFTVASDGWYSLRGHRSAGGQVKLYFIKETDERITVDVPLGAGDFEYSGPLLGAGLYEFYFGIDRLYTSSAVLDQQDNLEFELSVYRPAAVPIESSEWGSVKAQYR